MSSLGSTTDAVNAHEYFDRAHVYGGPKMQGLSKKYKGTRLFVTCGFLYSKPTHINDPRNVTCISNKRDFKTRRLIIMFDTNYITTIKMTRILSTLASIKKTGW